MKVDRDNVELLRAWEDGTWDVESYNCPDDPCADDFDAKAIAWAQNELAPMECYRKVVLWAVYAVHPNGFDHDD